MQSGYKKPGCKKKQGREVWREERASTQEQDGKRIRKTQRAEDVDDGGCGKLGKEHERGGRRAKSEDDETD